MGWIGCVRCNKFWHDFVAQNFGLIAPDQYVLHHISCGYEIIRNELKHYASHKNMSLGSNGVDRVRSLRKITMWLRGMDFCINCTCSPSFAQSFISYETIPNAPKHYEMHQNMNLGSNGIYRVRFLRKITKWLRGTNFCINGTSSPRFAPSFMLLWNDPKCTQTLCNAPKNEFIVQWGGSGAFVVKNYNVNSWHKLFH